MVSLKYFYLFQDVLNIKIIAKQVSCLILMLLTLCFLPSLAQAKNIRVGFFHFQGYHEIDERGYRSGYGYEYLQQLAKYNTWIYEYIGYEMSWAEAQQALLDGKIDLLTSAHKTPEREKQFDFSTKPVGYSTAILSVKAGNMRFLVGDYQNFNGIRVGLLLGSSRNAKFAEFAKQHGFNYRPVYFSSVDELTDALQSGTSIDAILTSNLRFREKEWVVAEFDPEPFYAVVAKGNHALLKELNNAIAQVEINTPALFVELNSKYYFPADESKIAFNADEIVYRHSLRREYGSILKAIMKPDNAPLSYFENGQPKGVVADIVHEIISRSGLPIEILPTKTLAEYEKLALRDDIAIKLDTSMSYGEAEKDSYKLTTPYLRLNVSEIFLGNKIGNRTRVGAVRDARITNDFINEYFPKENISYYDSVSDCVDAVMSGKVDRGFLNTLTAELAVYQDRTNNLTTVMENGFDVQLKIGVKNSADPCLLTMLDQSVLSLRPSFINAVLAKYGISA